jgi:membrane protease YdiL (CAAX protease family)
MRMQSSSVCGAPFFGAAIPSCNCNVARCLLTSEEVDRLLVFLPALPGARNRGIPIDKLTFKRLWLFLVITFAMTWTSWWSLATVFRASDGVFAHPLSALLYLVGGLGPTVAAIFAVALTPLQGTLREYASRLFRWRVSPIWWLAALAIPPAMAWLVERIDLLSAGSTLQAPSLEPLWRLALLFPLMIVGGGLEELGWRGVAQPELERRFSPLNAAIIVSFFWALWHLPLFFIPGTSQFGSNFGFFALQIFGTGFITAWLYDNTRSILLCILFHAAVNAAFAMGLLAPDVPTLSSLFGGAVRLVIGLVLVLTIRGRVVTQPRG